MGSENSSGAEGGAGRGPPAQPKGPRPSQKASGGVSQPCARQRASSWRGLHLSVGALVPLLTVESQPLRVRQLVLVALPAASGRVPVCLQVGVGMCARSGACAPLAMRPGRRCGACAACPPVAWSRFKVLECPE